MRYTVKYVVNGVINSDAPTDDLSKAIQREAVLSVIDDECYAVGLDELG
jgi:DNA-binding MltR family transcriptional regulator